MMMSKDCIRFTVVVVVILQPLCYCYCCLSLEKTRLGGRRFSYSKMPNIYLFGAIFCGGGGEMIKQQHIGKVHQQQQQQSQLSLVVHFTISLFYYFTLLLYDQCAALYDHNVNIWSNWVMIGNK